MPLIKPYNRAVISPVEYWRPQFRLRSLLFVVLAVAIITPVIAPYLHGLSALQWKLYGAALAAAAAGFAIPPMIWLAKHWISVRRGGELFAYTVRRYVHPAAHWALFSILGVFSGVVTACLIHVVSFLTVEFGTLPAGAYVVIGELGCLVGIFFPLITFQLWIGTTEVRRNGMMQGGCRFLPWSRLKNLELEELSGEDVCLIFYWSWRWFPWKLYFSKEQAVEVWQFIEQQRAAVKT